MKKIKEKIPIVLFILLTLLNYIVGIWLFEINLLFGASSIVLLFLSVLQIKIKSLFFAYIIYVVVYWSCLIYCLVTKRKKAEFIVFLILNSVEMLVCASFMTYKLCIANNSFIWMLFVGLLVKVTYYIWTFCYMRRHKTGNGGVS